LKRAEGQVPFEGAALPGSVRQRVRQEWQSSVSDIQRSEDAIQAIQCILWEGCLQAQSSQGGSGNERKTVLFDVGRNPFSRCESHLWGLEKEEAAELKQFQKKKPGRRCLFRTAPAGEAVTRYLRQRGYLLAK
jgi:hypothetical protein